MLKNIHIKKPQGDATPKKKISSNKITNIIFSIVLALAHITIFVAIALSYRYYSIYPSIFVSLVAIVLCVLIIGDIVFFVGFNHKDLGLKIISIVLASFLFLGGTVGSYFIAKANGIVSGALGNDKDTKYEIYSGVFISYDKYNSFSSLEELKDKKVGALNETSNGITYLAEKELNNANVKCEIIRFNTNAELLTALIDHNVDAAVLTSAYRSIYQNDENSSFADYLDNFVDFYNFEDQIKVTTNKTNKNIGSDPFNVLLIGYSRTDIGSPVGLADSIIVATINPQTYTVSMMSIARDSFVPIPCYGGEYDKINSGRSTSRACFIETVENFLGMEMDYYMELDYYGLVFIVETIGGINVDNDVEFTLDGVTVPAGENVFLNGMQALQYCRERHAYPDGDFARQRHQKEVIMKVARKFITAADINLCLKALDKASDYMATDLTLNQLTSIFNLLLNTKNFTSLDTFDLVDFQNLRITGDGGIRYYSYSMSLPLWIYQIYKGSYNESIAHINDVMGNYSSINQDYNFTFSAQKPYDRPAFYSLDYDPVYMYNPEPMPNYWANLKGMTLQEAVAWANSNGVSLSIKYINYGSTGYDSSLEGKVSEQSVRYGQLVSKNPTGTIYVMGLADETLLVPNFVGHSYSRVKEWANKYGIPYEIDFDTTVDGDVGDVVSQSVTAYSMREDCERIKVVVKAGTFDIKFNSNGFDSSVTVPGNISVTTGDNSKDLPTMSGFTKDGVKYSFAGWYTSQTDGTKVTSTSEVSGTNGSSTTLYAHWVKQYVVTLDANGGTCSMSSTTTDGNLPDASKEHHSFDGWYTSMTGGTKVTDLTSITGATTLYARYIENAKYTYKYVSDGSVVDSGTLYTDQNPSVPNVSKEGYSLSSWTQEGSKESGSITFTAVWTENTPSSEENENQGEGQQGEGQQGEGQQGEGQQGEGQQGEGQEHQGPPDGE